MPIPRTLPEFKAQCAAISLTVTIPEYMTGVSFFVHSPECLFVRIPPREMVLNTEAFLQDDRTSYPKLQIYSLISYEPIEIKPENKLSFHAARIGDYSLAFCH